MGWVFYTRYTADEEWWPLATYLGSDKKMAMDWFLEYTGRMRISCESLRVEKVQVA